MIVSNSWSVNCGTIVYFCDLVVYNWNVSLDQGLPLDCIIRKAGEFRLPFFSSYLQVKKSGKNEKADMSEFTAQLDSIGFKIVEVTVDGNCFLRFCSNTHHLDKIGGFCSYLCFTVTIT